MTKSNKSANPLRELMIEDMTMRRLGTHTQKYYLRAVVNLSKYLKRSPSSATAQELRTYQLDMTKQGHSYGVINSAISGLKFFFGTTLDQPERVRFLKYIHEPRKIPEILSVEEVAGVLQSAGSLKYRAALCVAYGAGLRGSEITHLKVSDVDTDRMILRVEQGKGKRDRNGLLSPELVIILDQWIRDGEQNNKMLPGGWLFPGQNPVNPLSTRQLSRAFLRARDEAGIDKKVTLHSLRHAFATHLLEQHVDIRMIQVLLGHNKLESTARYCHVAASRLREIKGPLTYLKM